jgi:hypothetical protein
MDVADDEGGYQDVLWCRRRQPGQKFACARGWVLASQTKLHTLMSHLGIWHIRASPQAESPFNRKRQT